MQNRRSKVLFITRGMGIGGAQKAIIFVANACANAGYKVSIISLTNTEPSININKKIEIKYAGYNPTLVNKDFLPKKVFHKLKLLLQLRQMVSKEKPDIVVTFMADIVRIVTYALLGTKTLIIGSERGNPLGYSMKQLKKYSKSYKKCDKVVFQTHKAASIFEESIQDKSIIIPNPSIPRLNPIEPFMGERRKIISAAGRLHVQKRFDILISAFSKVIKKYPDYQLHIYGEGSERKALEEIIRELNLMDYVTLKGETADVFVEANDHYAFVLCSDYEGIPNVLIEALSLGIPCISTDCDPGGPRKLFNDGRRGLLIPTGDIDRLANAICNYIENPELASQYGELGREVNNEFDPDLIAQKWNEVINSVIKSK